MSTKKKQVNQWEIERDNFVNKEMIDGEKFFGMKLDENQSNFVKQIINPATKIVFCDAVAGSGKTTIAAGCAEYMYKNGMSEGVIYVTAPVQEDNMGFLPGTVQEKTDIYSDPFITALDKIGVNTYVAIKRDENPESMFKGTAYIECRPHNYLRGLTFENRTVIIDEAQNFRFSELKKVITRCSDSCKVIVIGHTKQCDLKGSNESGFSKYIEAAIGQPFAAICELTNNYRGELSKWADSVDKYIDYKRMAQEGEVIEL